MRGISDADTIAGDILSSLGNFPSVSALYIVLGGLPVHPLTGRIRCARATSRMTRRSPANLCRSI
jgi:hypothetical protein